jgi:AcrR family transcriptional regulator
VERFADRVRRDLRAALLDAARDALMTSGFRGLRMGAIAAAVGVSRQTVYNEFGDKLGLAQALVLDHTASLLDGIDAALTSFPDTSDAIRAAATYVLDTSAADPFTKVAMTGEPSVEILPLLTTRGEPVLVAARDRIAAHLRARCGDARDVDLAAETAVRLVVSHLMLNLDPVEVAADKITRAVTALLKGTP